jgi:integrase
MASRVQGIRVRHSRQCPTNKDRTAACRGGCPVEAWVYDAREGAKIRKTFAGPGALAAAKAWRQDVAGEVRRGRLRAAPAVTLKQAADELVAGIKTGAIRKRGGEPYSPRVAKDYEEALATVVPMLGESRRLSQIAAEDIERLVRDLRGKGRSESRIRNLTNPLRVIYRHHRRTVPVSPLAGVEIGQAGKRDRAAGPAEITMLLGPLDQQARLAFAIAAYAGLRAGEIAALEVADVKMGAGTLTVRRSYDFHTGTWKAPKSAAGTRTVPLKATGPLVRIVNEYLAATGRTDGLLLGPDGATPFVLLSLHRRAKKSWAAANKKRGKLELDPMQPIGLHELRHSCGSNWLAAGVPLPRVSAWLGHAHVGITAARYAHAVDGGSDADAALVERYYAEVSA